ncbi:flagellar hook-associated protein FlgK [Ramlibacter sp. MAHUQ-53]|uniref:flagellar hook-associated protein FlgK n=1 Tax=unclassified Ramlibacter TaxID=2617605 RepID=UPI003637D7F5
MTSLLNIGTSSLAAAQGQLTTISHNIANANTVGYSRQEAQQATAGGLMTGAGFFGRGVDMATVQRRYDQFAAASVLASTSQAAADASRSEALSQLDALFANGDLGVGASIDQLFAATGDLANRPGDTATRQAFLARAADLAQRATSLGTQLQDLATQADAQLAQTATQVNDRLAEIQRLNERIASLAAGGQPPNDLLDQREQAIAQLGGLMAVRTVTGADGSINLFTPGGSPLIVGTQRSVLVAAPDPSSPGTTGLRLDIGTGTSQWLEGPDLGGGSLAGLMQFRDQDLQAARTRLGSLVQGLADAFNAQHQLGTDANGAPGQPLFAVALATDGVANGLKALALSAAQVATGQASMVEAGAANTGGARVAAFSVTRTTPDSALAVSITFNNPPTTFNITGLAGGNLSNVPYTPGQAIPPAPADYNGWRLTLEGAPAAGDSFGLQATAYPRSDNRNALALGQLARLAGANGTFNEAYAGLLADVGNRVQGAREMANVSAAMKDEALARQASAAGVNLDEEAANLLRFQQAYQASAKIIQASQLLFDTLLSATRG